MPVLLETPRLTKKPQMGTYYRGNKLSDGLWAVWDGLEGGGLKAIDGCRNRHGTIGSGVVHRAADNPRIGGPAWQFDGTANLTEVIDVTNTQTDYDFGTRFFSIEAWFLGTSSGTFRDIFRYDNSQTTGLFGIRVSNTGVLNFLIADGSRNVSQVSTTTDYEDGTWHHVVAARNNGTLFIYVDGKLQVSGTDGSRSILGTSTTKALIGGAYNTSTGQPQTTWVGMIANVRIRTDVVTSANDAMEMYLNPWGIYQSPLYQSLRLDTVAAGATVVKDIIGGFGVVPFAR